MKSSVPISRESGASRMFYWVVRHLRGLARVPTLAQVFDGLLAAWIGFVRPECLSAMALLEGEVLRMPEVSLRVHRLGGTEFYHAVLGELGHIHGHGLLDVRVGRSLAGGLLARGRVREHHALPRAGWISFQVRDCSDVPAAIRLLKLARRWRASRAL